MTTKGTEQQALQDEIKSLEEQLAAAKSKLSASCQQVPPASNADTQDPLTTLIPQTESLHTLLLLADSQLPLGSFAFSSGLESFLAHNKLKGSKVAGQSQQALFNSFLELSLQSLASTALPYMLAAYRSPHELQELDNDFDASTPCTVARRASVAQGRALLSVWERSFKGHYAATSKGEQAHETLKAFSTALRTTASDLLPANAHLAPLWGVITLLLHVDIHSSAYMFLFSHARTVISAALRANVLGPYQAQAVLARVSLREQIDKLVRHYWDRKTEDAGQSAPVLDLWVGRHEKLYSRIFNS